MHWTVEEVEDLPAETFEDLVDWLSDEAARQADR